MPGIKIEPPHDVADRKPWDGLRLLVSHSAPRRDMSKRLPLAYLDSDPSLEKTFEPIDGQP